MAKVYEFKPAKQLGMGGTYKGLAAYKKALKDAVDTNQSTISQCGPSGANLPTYLKWTIDNIGGSTAFANNDPVSMNNFFKNLGPTPSQTDNNYQTYKKLLVYWAENLGPINMMENHSDVFPNNSTVLIPAETSTGLWDFKINDAEISVKAPKGATNVVKPQDITANEELAKRMRGSTPSENVKKVYKVLKALGERGAFPGPAYVVYGDKGDNGILSQDLKHLAMKTPVPPPICYDLQTQKDRWKETEKAVQSWGSSRLIEPAIKLLMHNFLQYSGLTLLKMEISTRTGVPTFTWGSNLTEAFLKGKGQKHGERMGIGIKFNEKFSTKGF